MAKISGVDGKPLLSVDSSKLTPSKLKCLQSRDAQSLIEAWAVGEVDNADVQTWLMFQMVASLMTANAGGGIIRPS